MFEGVGVALVTLFGDDGTLDAVATADLDEGELRAIRTSSQERDPAKRRAALERLG